MAVSNDTSMATLKDLHQLEERAPSAANSEFRLQLRKLRKSKQPVFRGTRSNMGKGKTVCVAQKVDWKQDLAEKKSTSCLCCNGPHNLWKYPTFKMKAVRSRH